MGLTVKEKLVAAGENQCPNTVKSHKARLTARRYPTMAVKVWAEAHLPRKETEG